MMRFAYALAIVNAFVAACLLALVITIASNE